MIRRATLADIEILLRLDAECFARAWSSEGWTEEFVPASGEGLVLLSGDPACGFASAPILDDRCELRRIGVLAYARRQGIGRDLLLGVVSHARGRGCSSVELEVGAGNEEAVGLYGALGFQVVGRRPHYYRNPPDDALLMDLNLGGRGTSDHL